MIKLIAIIVLFMCGCASRPDAVSGGDVSFPEVEKWWRIQ